MKIFVHNVGPDGQIAAQWDGLGVAWEGWRKGDYLIQIHSFTLPSDAPAGTYETRIGLYDPETLLRWQFQWADHTTDYRAIVINIVR